MQRAAIRQPFYAVYTIDRCDVTRGAELCVHKMRSGVNVNVLSLGEAQLCRPVFLPVSGVRRDMPCPRRLLGHSWPILYKCNCPQCGVGLGEKIKRSLRSRKLSHPDDGLVPGRLEFASVSTGFRSVKLHAGAEPSTNRKIIVVLKNRICKRGIGRFIGETIGWHCECGAREYAPKPDCCPNCSAKPKALIMPFPGKVLAECAIPQPYYGSHIIALVDVGQVFQVQYKNAFGREETHCYMWDGSALLNASLADRDREDIF